MAFWKTAPSGERRCTIWYDYNLNESDNVMKRVQLQNITMLYLSPHRTVIKIERAFLANTKGETITDLMLG